MLSPRDSYSPNMEANLFHSFFLIFTGAALIASLALYSRQPLLVAYILLGILLGPHVLGWVDNVPMLTEISRIGIIFLLFLLGLDMQPKSLMSVLKEATFVGLISSAIFAISGYGLGRIFGFSHTDCLVIGMALMFSSTIIGIKLLPTTVLHHRHTGELMVGLLLFQDFLAIVCLLVLLSGDLGTVDVKKLGFAFLQLPLVAGFAFLFVRYVLLKLILKFDRIHEYVFLVALGWCLGLAQLTHAIGLSAEIGAFLAGITLATSPIAQYIALSLKPLRDFFLILFFFSLGASMNMDLVGEVLLAGVVIASVVILGKPAVFRVLLSKQSEKKLMSWNVGFRLGQISEFSLLIALIALNGSLISERASTLIQVTAILTFLVSSYIVVLYLPTPIAVKDELRRD
ncbi:cation:proton antiporter [Aurantivibrio plasticivorans]